MSTVTKFHSYTCKDLAQMAKKRGISGWHSMRKDELVEALVKSAGKAKKRNGSRNGVSARVARSSKTRPTAAQRRLKRVYREEVRRKDLSTGHASHGEQEDRLVLMVRDPNWLQATWEICSGSIDRARVALAEAWHAAEPVLRLVEVPDSGSNETAERIVRVIPINGVMQTWFIDVTESRKRYRVEIGYENGERFQPVVRSNTVTTPAADNEGSEAAIAEVIQDSERIFAMSGGYGADATGNELREWFENRLARPLGGPRATQFGEGAQAILERPNALQFEIEAEMVVTGRAPADAFVTVSGEPVSMNPDGHFTMRVSLPDRRQVLPMVATSRNGAAEQTIILAIERNTKVLEPVVHEPGD